MRPSATSSTTWMRVRDRILPELEDRPLSVIRVHRGQEAFMQKNVPKYTPDWVPTVHLWAETSQRDVSYALCNDRRTLLWFANQRAVEYHPTLVRASDLDHMTHLVLDLDPPEGDAFPMAVARRPPRPPGAGRRRPGGRGQDERRQGRARVRARSSDDVPLEDAAAATRAIAARAERLDPELATTTFMKDDRGGKVFVDATRVGGATVIAAYSPRVRPGVPVSFPVALGRPRRRSRRPSSPCTPRPGCSATSDPWAGAHARAAADQRRPHRGGARHPDGPRPGHARGQAAGPGPPPRRGRRAGRLRRRGREPLSERNGRRFGRLGPCPSSSTTPSWRGATPRPRPAGSPRCSGSTAPQHLGPFWQVETANGVALDFGSTGDRDIAPQHYAFLVDERDFDAIHGRIVERGLDHWADPTQRRPGEINHHHGGRGVYFLSPDGHFLEILTRPYGSGG